jgi:hypothetical protein
MKPIQAFLVILGAALAAFGGASVALMGKGEPAVRETTAVAPRDDAAAQDTAAAQPAPFANSELDGLRGAVANLQREVDDLRAQLARRAAEPVETANATGTVATAEAVAEVQRDAIVRVMEEERQREQQKRDEERKAREKEALDRMAERAAKDLGLSPADQTRYSEYLTVASAKREEMFAGMRGGGGNGGGPQDFRTAWEDYRAWSENELKGTFGDNLGQQIGDWQREQMRGGFGDMGGRGNFGGQTSGGAPQGAPGATGGNTGRGRGR